MTVKPDDWIRIEKGNYLIRLRDVCRVFLGPWSGREQQVYIETTRGHFMPVTDMSPDVEHLRRFARTVVERLGGKVVDWTEIAP